LEHVIVKGFGLASFDTLGFDHTSAMCYIGVTDDDVGSLGFENVSETE
jgi:hypothetical protein